MRWKKQTKCGYPQIWFIITGSPVEAG